MLGQTIFGVLLLGLAVQSSGDVIQLKDNASVTGQVLADKRDQVAVDVGYTVLVIPKDQVLAIKKSDAASTDKDKAKTDSSAKETVKPTAEDVPFFNSNTGSEPQERSVRELVSLLGEAVVQVRTPSGLGSGFIINPEGFLITNFHVIEGDTQISVEVYHQRNGQLERKTYRDVRIVAMNKFQDITLLKIDDKDAPKFKFVALGDSDLLSVGEHVFAIGSPLGLERTVTEGIVSTKTRQIQGELFLQTTTQINPGNSGGPLFNLKGEVVGITNMKATFGEGLGFAIPIQAVKYFLNHRDAFSYDNDNPSSPYRYLEPPSRISKAITE